MKNREIKIEELRVGDEVLIGTSGNLLRVKLLRPLKLSKKKNWRGDDVYGSVKCGYHQELRKFNVPGRTYTYTDKINKISDDLEYNSEKYVDFNYRKIWLLKREELWNND